MSLRGRSYDDRDLCPLTDADKLGRHPDPDHLDGSFDEAWPLTLQVAWHQYHAPNRDRRTSLGDEAPPVPTHAPGDCLLPSGPAPGACNPLHPPA